MIRCKSCQKPTEGREQYHGNCLKRLFGVPVIPTITFSIADLPAQVSSNAIGNMSISGAQIKASIKVNSQQKQIEVARADGTHILKPEPNEFPELPQNENLCMNIAEALGMEVPPHGLFQMADGKACYIILRFDRLSDGSRIHKEDMAQLLGAAPNAKYEGSLEAVAKAIVKYTKNALLDVTNFYERVLLSFVIGNGDMHLKNWSLLTPKEGNRLAPCYDLVSSSIYLPREEESALTINGKKSKLGKTDFQALANTVHIDLRAARNSFQKIINAKDLVIKMVAESELSLTRKEQLTSLIQSRYNRLQA